MAQHGVGQLEKMPPLSIPMALLFFNVGVESGLQNSGQTPAMSNRIEAAPSSCKAAMQMR